MLDYAVNFASYRIGPRAYGEVGRVCAPHGSRVVLIGGKTAMEKGLEELRGAISGSGLELVDCVAYGHECTYRRIGELAELCKERRADMVFGMGGGKALDTAKGAAGACGLPVFTFPTIAATCAATTALSVVYKEDGTLDEMLFFDGPALCSFINTSIIARAPARYLRAGMGDTLGKHYECHLSARGDVLDHSSLLGREVSNLCRGPVLEHGEQALRDCERGEVTGTLQEAVLAIIVSTGLVSLLVNDDYNCAVAHSVCYGLAVLPGFEEANLHGDVVAYGVLVQLAVDGRPEELARVRAFLRAVGIPVTLAQMGVPLDRQRLEPVLEETVAGPDMAHLPYPVDKEMVFAAMSAVEALTD